MAHSEGECLRSELKQILRSPVIYQICLVGLLMHHDTKCVDGGFKLQEVGQTITFLLVALEFLGYTKY